MPAAIQQGRHTMPITEENMTLRTKLVSAGAIAALSTLITGAAMAQGPMIGVSWSNFQEERWKTDEAAIKAAIAKAGGTYISADAQSSSEEHTSELQSLMRHS